jgi:hypothetical protein
VLVKTAFADAEGAHRSTQDSILRIQHSASKKAILGMEGGGSAIKLCAQRPETPIFDHPGDPLLLSVLYFEKEGALFKRG